MSQYLKTMIVNNNTSPPDVVCIDHTWHACCLSSLWCVWCWCDEIQVSSVCQSRLCDTVCQHP